MDVDYKELYEQAVKRAKEKLTDAKVEEIFPELVTPDERMSKAIGCALTCNSAESLLKAHGVRLGDALEWLNNKKNAKTPQWMIDFLDGVRRTIGCPVDYDDKKEVDGGILAIRQFLEGNPNIQRQLSEEDKANIYGIEETYAYIFDCLRGSKVFDAGNQNMWDQCTDEREWLRRKLNYEIPKEFK